MKYLTILMTLMLLLACSATKMITCLNGEVVVINKQEDLGFINKTTKNILDAHYGIVKGNRNSEKQTEANQSIYEILAPLASYETELKILQNLMRSYPCDTAIRNDFKELFTQCIELNNTLLTKYLQPVNEMKDESNLSGDQMDQYLFLLQSLK